MKEKNFATEKTEKMGEKRLKRKLEKINIEK